MSHDPALPDPEVDAATLRKVTGAAVAGTVIEWFDFAIYGFMAPIIAITFFPEGSRVAGLLQTFAIFAVAFALRPVGGAYLRIPEHPATDSDHIRPPVPTHSATYDALP